MFLVSLIVVKFYIVFNYITINHACNFKSFVLITRSTKGEGTRTLMMINLGTLHTI